MNGRDDPQEPVRYAPLAQQARRIEPGDAPDQESPWEIPSLSSCLLEALVIPALFAVLIVGPLLGYLIASGAL